MLRQPREKLSQSTGAFQCLPIRLELDPSIEVPTDKHDAMLRFEHGGLYKPKVQGGIDYDRESVGSFDPPACLARDKKACVVRRHAVAAYSCATLHPPSSGTIEVALSDRLEGTGADVFARSVCGNSSVSLLARTARKRNIVRALCVNFHMRLDLFGLAAKALYILAAAILLILSLTLILCAV
jgi:hypothetical protein